MAGTGDEVSPEARLMAAAARARAAATPGPGRLAALATEALSYAGRGMTTAEIRELAEETITQAQHVSYLLGRLAGLLGDGEGDPRGE